MNYVINGICLLVLIILFAWISMDMMISFKKKIGMNTCVLLTFMSALSLILCHQVENNGSNLIIFSVIFNMIGFVLSPFIFMIEAYSFIGEMKLKNIWYFIPAIINTLCVITSPFTEWIFYISNNNEYFRGDYYGIYVFAFVFSIFYSWAIKMSIVSSLPSYFYKKILFSSFMLFPCLATQIFLPDIQITYLIITIHLLLYYGLSSQIASLTDGLTGLLNRGAFENYMKNIKISKKYKLAVVVLDVDDFKTLNDEHGHIYGDICLKQIAGFLNDVFHRHIFRIGGDEFIVLIKIHDENEIIQALELIKSKASAKKKTYPDFPTLSYGYDLYEKGMNIQDVLNHADLRMYENKKNKL